jgi:MFS family permease
MGAPEAATLREGTAPAGGRRAGVRTVFLIVFVDLLGFGVIVPVLPFYVRSFAVSDVFIGLLAATYSLAQFGAAPVLGRLSDERGRRPVVLLSLAGGAVAWTAFGLAGQVAAAGGTVAGLAVLFGSRLLAGAMGGNIAAAQAYVADVTPPERRAGALGLVGAAFGLGFVFGPALGGLVASDAAVAVARGLLPAAVPATRFSLPAFLAAGFSALAFVLAAAFLREPPRRRTAGEERVGFLGGIRAALAVPALRGLVGAFFVVSLAFSGVQVMFVPFTADVYGYGPTATAFLLTYVGALGALNQGVVIGRLARRYPERRLAVAGAALLVVALAGLPFAPALGRTLPAPGGPAWATRELLGLVVVLTCLSAGNGTLTVSLTALVSRGAGAETQGIAFGVAQGAGSLGRTLGPPAMAALYVVGYPLPFVTGAVLVLAVVAALARGRVESGSG